jgi:hypothetical protein
MKDQTNGKKEETMIQTKSEKIKQYNEGILKDCARYNPSVFDVYVIVECDNEQVFGYYQYMDEEKHFFNRKLYFNNLTDDEMDYYFRINNKVLHLSEFLRNMF